MLNAFANRAGHAFTFSFLSIFLPRALIPHSRIWKAGEVSKEPRSKRNLRVDTPHFAGFAVRIFRIPLCPLAVAPPHSSCAIKASSRREDRWDGVLCTFMHCACPNTGASDSIFTLLQALLLLLIFIWFFVTQCATHKQTAHCSPPTRGKR